MSRFDYVRYDKEAIAIQDAAKIAFQNLEAAAEAFVIPTPTEENKKAVGELARSKALFLTHLEETYMWMGKMIRNQQILRNGLAPLQEERKDG